MSLNLIWGGTGDRAQIVDTKTGFPAARRRRNKFTKVQEVSLINREFVITCRYHGNWYAWGQEQNSFITQWMTSTFIIHYLNLNPNLPGVYGILCIRLIQQDCSFSSGHYSFSSCVGGAEVVHPIHYSDNGIEFLNQFYINLHTHKFSELWCL